MLKPSYVLYMFGKPVSLGSQQYVLRPKASLLNALAQKHILLNMSVEPKFYILPTTGRMLYIRGIIYTGTIRVQNENSSMCDISGRLHILSKRYKWAFLTRVPSARLRSFGTTIGLKHCNRIHIGFVDSMLVPNELQVVSSQLSVHDRCLISLTGAVSHGS
jgi:hypothetical protein